MTCSRPSCGAKSHRRGLCRQHYNHWRATRPIGRVAVGPVRDHLQRLMDAGMTKDRIAELAGVSRTSTVTAVFHPDRRHLRAATAAKVFSVAVPEVHGPTSDISRLVPATGVRRRIQALVANGYQMADLAARLGVCWQTVSMIVNGRRRDVRVELARAVDGLFRELELVPGGDRRAVGWARRRGWPPPLAWDHETIDNPDIEPCVAEGKTGWLDEYDELKDMGFDDRQIADRMGIRRDALMARLRRMGAGP